MKDFFVSYNQADRQWAEWIAWQLEKEKYTTVVQAWDFRPGGNFMQQMREAAKGCARTMALLSPDYLESLYGQQEWDAAMAADPTGEKGTLIPVRVRECELEGLDRPVVYIDLVGLEGDDDRAREALLQGVRRERAKPSKPPRIPGAAKKAAAAEPRFPGALPPIWNVPFRRNPNFSGRGQEMEQLEAALDSGEPAALCQAIAGMGGVGKTQLAVEYAYRHLGDYKLVWWLRCEEPATLKGDYAALGKRLGLEEPPELDQAVAQVKEWLERHPGWLLIFDNAHEPDHLRPYLPQAGGGRVLITSRNRAWGTVAKPFEVDLWTKEESVAFLETRTGRAEPEAAAELAEELGRLPLALEQAAAYIVEKDRSLAGYLKLFRKHHLEVLEEGRPGDRYEGTVGTTWKLALAEVEQVSPAASQLMALCSYLAPEEIPLDVLRDGREHLPEPLQGALGDELALDEALGALLRYSLIERSGLKISVHRLVQEVLLRGSKIGRHLWRAALEILAEAMRKMSYQDTRVWPYCDRLQPHALVVLERAGTESPAAAGSLWNDLGRYAYARADFLEANRRFERALKINEAAYGPDHPEVGANFNNLGLVLRGLGDLEGAKALFERALKISEAAYGPDHDEVAINVNNLGLVLLDLGDPQGARRHFERALAIDEAACGTDHPSLAKGINNLGTALRDLGDLEGARAHLERALAIDEAAYGPNQPVVAVRANNLGLVLKDLGDLKGAKEHLERALAIDEAAYGPDHPSVAGRENNLGLLLQKVGNMEEARVHLGRALKINEAAYGPDHPEVGTNANNLGIVLRDLGDLEGARTHLKRALDIATRSLGPDHPRTQASRRNLKSLGR